MSIEDTVEDTLDRSFLSEAQFIEKLSQQLLAPIQYGGLTALLHIKMDAYVPGIAFAGAPDASDTLLLLTLDRLAHCFETGDLLARRKPGVVLVLLRYLRCEDDLDLICERVVRMGQRPLWFEGKRFLSGFSVGAAIVGKQETDARSFIEQAISTMPYHGRSRNNSRLLPSDSAEEHSVPSDIESYVRYALLNKLFGLRFQPQYSENGVLTGVDVLTQMQMPGAAWIAAEDFVPWVEDSELILEMSKQALRSICLQARDWFQRDVPIPSFSIAIPTAHLLQNDFLETVLALLEETGIPGRVLELCLTEATIMTNIEATTNLLHALSTRGVRFCICGYGLAGFTTSLVRHLPIQTLQVNCKESALPSTDGIDILRAVVSHGRRLGLAIRAKDVQSAAQRSALIEAGCLAFQGQLMSRTLSKEEMENISFSPLGS